MNEILSTVLVLFVKLLLAIGFISLTKFWLNKKNNLAPILVYWILGLFFVLMQIHQIFNWIFFWTLFDKNSLVWDMDSINSLSVIIGLGVYIFIGVKYFKKRNTIGPSFQN